jgi:hypothetical protein
VGFPTDSVVVDGTVYLYHGVCDTAVALATAPLDALIERVMQDRVAQERAALVRSEADRASIAAAPARAGGPASAGAAARGLALVLSICADQPQNQSRAVLK